jgi:hypothetical protein
MSYVVIAGTSIKAARVQQLPDEVGGSMQRTLSGQLRGEAGWRKRAWSVDAITLTDAEHAALLALADGFTVRTITGTRIGGTVSAVVERSTAEQARRGDGGMTLTLREV